MAKSAKKTVENVHFSGLRGGSRAPFQGGGVPPPPFLIPWPCLAVVMHGFANLPLHESHVFLGFSFVFFPANMPSFCTSRGAESDVVAGAAFPQSALVTLDVGGQVFRCAVATLASE